MIHFGLNSKHSNIFHKQNEHQIATSKPLYLTNTLRSFALSLTGIFIPIYLFQNVPKHFLENFNIEPSVNKTIIFVVLFYLLKSTFILVFLHFSINFMFGKLSFKTSIMTGNFLLALGIFMLIQMEYLPVTLIIVMASMIFALSNIFYWIPFHTFFIRSNIESLHYGKEVSQRVFWSNMVSAISPAIGGFVAFIYGFESLFMFAMAVLILSGLPTLFYTKEHAHGKHNSIKIIKTYFFSKRYTLNMLGTMAIGIDSIMFEIFSAILLFSVSPVIADIGYISSIAVILMMWITIIMGKIVDQVGARDLQKVGLILNSLLYIPRFFVTGLPTVFAIHILDKMNSSLIAVPLAATTYETARNEVNQSDYIIYREFSINLGLIIFSSFFILMLAYGFNWRSIFLLLAILSPFAYLIKVLDKKENS